MSDKSPLFVSALELIAHATELYVQGHPRKYKFVILHLANAIELILKDRLIDKGVSIYKPRASETIGIWSSFDELGKVGVNIAERPIIELLVDDRNTIQHRFGFPDAESVYYYLDNTIAFFKRFIYEEYGVNLADALKSHTSPENLAFLGLIEDEYSHLSKLAQISPESAIVQAMNAVELGFAEFMEIDLTQIKQPLWSNPSFRLVLRELAQHNYISRELAEGFETLRVIRNNAAHGRISSKEEAKKCGQSNSHNKRFVGRY
jgi:uncharacterized protein YutE (UPF0331/DUF86 family)